MKWKKPGIIASGKLIGLVTPLLLLLPATQSLAQVEATFIDDTPVNYIYAAVLGTGFYDLSGKRIAVVRAPFSLKKRHLGENIRWRFLYPVALGYENMGEDNEFEKWIPNEIVTLTAVPGVEFFYRPAENWLIKPFLQAGLGRDYTQHETTTIGMAGTRVLGDLYNSEQWQITLGNSLQWAGEKLQHKDQYSSFGMFELGTNMKRHLPVSLWGRQLNMSFYGLWQTFFNQQTSNYPLAKPVDVDNLYHFGTSLGLRRPKSFLGFDFDTVSVGLVVGENSYALTFGTGFPF